MTLQKQRFDYTMSFSLLCGARRPGLSVTPLGVNGHCGPKSGNHGMPNMLPACPSLVWGHASRKLPENCMQACPTTGIFSKGDAPAAKNAPHKTDRHNPRNANKVLEAADWPIKK